SELLEDAQKEGLVELDTDKRSRTYVVTRFGAELTAAKQQPPQAAAKTKGRRRRSSAKRRSQKPSSQAAGEASAETAAAPGSADTGGRERAPEPPRAGRLSERAASIRDEDISF